MNPRVFVIVCAWVAVAAAVIILLALAEHTGSPLMAISAWTLSVSMLYIIYIELRLVRRVLYSFGFLLFVLCLFVLYCAYGAGRL